AGIGRRDVDPFRADPLAIALPEQYQIEIFLGGIDLLLERAKLHRGVAGFGVDRRVERAFRPGRCALGRRLRRECHGGEGERRPADLAAVLHPALSLIHESLAKRFRIIGMAPPASSVASSGAVSTSTRTATRSV